MQEGSKKSRCLPHVGMVGLTWGIPKGGVPEKRDLRDEDEACWYMNGTALPHDRKAKDGHCKRYCRTTRQEQELHKINLVSI